jgi:hypothetical protein
VSDLARPAPARAAPQDARVHAPARGNKRLQKLLDAVDADLQVKGWWHAAAVNAERLNMSDHSWVHIQIVLNIALRLSWHVRARRDGEHRRRPSAHEHPLAVGPRDRGGADRRGRRQGRPRRDRDVQLGADPRVHEGLGTKLRGAPLEAHIEVVARIEAEHEQRLVPIFRL